MSEDSRYYFKEVIPCDKCDVKVSRLEYYHVRYYEHFGYKFKLCSRCTKILESENDPNRFHTVNKSLIKKNIQKIREFKLKRLLDE